MWPGFGENVRVLKWILERVEGRGGAKRRRLGLCLRATALTLDGLQLSPEALDELLQVNGDDWEAEMEDTRQFFDKFGNRLPSVLREEHQKLARRFHHAVTA